MVHCLGRCVDVASPRRPGGNYHSGPGASLNIRLSTQFQFCCYGAVLLSVIGVTMPPWPGGEEAVFVHGPWQS